MARPRTPKSLGTAQVEYCQKYSGDQFVRCLKEQTDQLIRRAALENIKATMDEWLVEFGIDPQADDADIDLEVARRRGKLFAVILTRCYDDHVAGNPNATAFKDCLAYQAEVERRLGQPAQLEFHMNI